MTGLKEKLSGIVTELGLMDKEADLWDKTPGLFVVMNATEETDGKLRVAFLDFSVEFWSAGGGDPVRVMQALTMALFHPEAPIPNWPITPDDEIIALTLRTEGWGLGSPKPPAGLEGDALKQWQNDWAAEQVKRGRFVDNPNAIEVKSYSAVSTEEDAIAYTIYRKPKYGDISVPDDGLTDHCEGRVYDAMRELLASFRWRFGSA